MRMIVLPTLFALLSAGVILGGGCSCSSSAAREEALPEPPAAMPAPGPLSLDRAYQLWLDPDTFAEHQWIDVRFPEQVARNRMIQGFERRELEMIGHWATRYETDRGIILICRTHNRSADAFHILTRMGFERVYYIHGGYSDWARRYPITRY